MIIRVDELETPVPVVDMDRLEANISRLQAYLDEHRIANRPHIKNSQDPGNRPPAAGCRRCRDHLPEGQ